MKKNHSYLITQFELHHRLYNNVLNGFTDIESNERPCDNKNVNPVKYLAGHLLNSQYGLIMIAGHHPEIKWDELFAVMGKSEFDTSNTYPLLSEIQYEWNRWHQPTTKGLEALSREDLHATPPAPFDQVASSAGELWAFINHHQAYHIGQIGLIRRIFGKDPMSFD
ncbi:MAG: DinB family protein [Balneolaceae bacterium]